jgi:hypothetical protein
LLRSKCRTATQGDEAAVTKFAIQGTRAVLLLTIGLLAVLPCWSAASVERRTIAVSTPAELYAAVHQANGRGNTEIVLEDGEYRLTRALRIEGDRITLRSASLDRDATVLRGNGMRSTGSVDNLVEVSGRYVTLAGLTLREAGNHLVQLRGERDADFFRLIDCALIDGYQQLLKVSAGDNNSSADGGLVRNTLFAYTNARGPGYYIGGIDLHRGRDWLIENNTFRNIASPSQRVAEYAIHLWSGSANGRVRNNLVINSDRGVGFGLSRNPARGNEGGEIIGNVIIHLRDGDPASDVGIALENSPRTQVIGNYIHLAHAYPNAIEFRFPGTRDVVISGNTVNRAIASRDGGHALVEGNQGVSAVRSGFDYLHYAFTRLRARFVDGS